MLIKSAIIHWHSCFNTVIAKITLTPYFKSHLSNSRSKDCQLHVYNINVYYEYHTPTVNTQLVTIYHQYHKFTTCIQMEYRWWLYVAVTIWVSTMMVRECYRKLGTTLPIWQETIIIIKNKKKLIQELPGKNNDMGCLWSCVINNQNKHVVKSVYQTWDDL